MQYPDKINNLKRFKWLFTPATYIIVLCIGIFVLRIPNLVPPRLSVDEDQWVVTGTAYAHGGVFWKTISGNTSGPLVYALPLIMAPIDGLNNCTIRIFGLLFCIIPAIYFLWKTLKLLYGDITAQIGVISLFIYIASIDEGEFIAYNSEHLPMMLSSLSIFLLFSIVRSNDISLKNLASLGIVLGLMPYGKLQIVPAGFCIGALGLFEIASRNTTLLKMRARAILTLTIGALLPSLFIALYLTRHNAWDDFWNNYIVNNLLYMSHRGGSAQAFEPLKGTGKLTFVITLILKNHYLTKFVLSQLMVVLAIIILQFNKSLFRSRVLWYSIFIALSAYISVISPGNPFSHYIYLFIIPFVFVTSCFIGESLSITDPAGSSKSYRLVYFVPLFIYITLVLWKSPMPQGTHFILSKQTLSISDASKEIRKYAHPGEYMSVWGWGIYSFIETDLILGNKSASLFYEMYTLENPSLLDEYLSYMKANKPIVFFDVQPEISNRKERFRHEHYPKLNDYITQNYKEVGEYDGKRIYILNERQRAIDSLAIHQ